MKPCNIYRVTVAFDDDDFTNVDFWDIWYAIAFYNGRCKNTCAYVSLTELHPDKHGGWSYFKTIQKDSKQIESLPK